MMLKDIVCCWPVCQSGARWLLGRTSVGRGGFETECPWDCDPSAGFSCVFFFSAERWDGELHRRLMTTSEG